MGLDSQLYIREIENLQPDALHFEGDSRFIAPAVLLVIVLTTLLCGYGLSLLVGSLIR
ncbi:MAG: hypothetical protein WC216_02225 [Gallionella sp.]|jgi:hypothetical protein